MDKSVGVAGSTVNVTAALVPPGVETVTLRGPTVAVGLIVKVVVRDVAPRTLTGPTVTSALLIETVAPATKPVPVSVTLTDAPCRPAAGLIEVSAGGARPTVKIAALLVPPGVETVTFRGPGVAVGLIVNEVVRPVGLPTTIPPSVMPPPLTA